MTHKRAYLFIAGPALLMGLYVWHCLSVGYTSDDGFIAFQYVKNLLHGNGLVYNLGEKVEGYNNFLWVILLAGLSWLLPTVKLLNIAQAVGILFGALTILLVCRFSRMVRTSGGPFALLAGAFLAVHSGFAAWATGGLETTLFAFLIFAGSYAYVLYLKSGRNYLAVPILFALAAMTRPDAILFFGVTILHATLFHKRRDGTLFSRVTLSWVLVFVLIYLPYYLWRFNYYGYPFPNTVYAKVGGGISTYIRGAYYVLEYVKWYGAFVFIPPLILLLRKKREIWIDYFALLVGAYVAYLIYVGGDGLAFFRFVAYIAPLIYVLVQEGFSYLFERAQQANFLPAGWKLAAPSALLVLVSLAFTMRQTVLPILVPSRMQWYEPHSELRFPGTGTSHAYLWFDNYFVDRQEIAARWLEANAKPGALVASTPAGAIAYFMNHRVLDMLGLNDLYIARSKVEGMGYGRAGHEKGDGKYVLTRSPDYILLGNVAVLPFPLDETTMEDKLILRSEHELWADPEFHKNYELHSVRLADTGVFQYFSFYQKKDPALSIRTQSTSESGDQKGNSR
jgi:hypothetical protein